MDDALMKEIDDEEAEANEEEGDDDEAGQEG